VTDPIYPPAPEGADADTLHGVEVPDPYRGLEDTASVETREWSGAEDALVTEWFAAPTRAAARRVLGERLRALLPGSVGLPAARGDRVFFERRHPDQEHAVLVVRAPGGERVLLDPAAWAEDATTTLDGWWPSWEGSRLAYATSERGEEDESLHVLDVTTETLIDGPIPCGRAVDVAWFPGGDHLLYVRRAPNLPGAERQFHRRVWRHAVGAPVDGDELVFGAGRDKTSYYAVGVSLDGRWAWVTASLGTAPRNDVWLADLADGWPPRWQALQEGVDASTWPRFGDDGRLYLLTDRDAPRRRLAVVDPAHAHDGPWRDVVPESPDAVLESYALTDDVIAVCRTHAVVAEIDLVDRITGDPVAALALPGLGSAAVTGRPGPGRDVWVSFTDYRTPPMVLHAEVGGAPGDEAVERWAEPLGGPALAGLSVRRVTVASADGTPIPMWIVAHGEDGPPRPAVLYGYGGFGISLTPSYSAAVAAWAEAGGVWAVGNLRGGGEFGEEWHRAGMRADKQRVFDDFAACADWLVAEGWTSPATLGIYGGSNGGLLVGAALTQRPDRYRAVVCSAPLLDMVRYEQFGLGVTWNDEFGTAASPTELGWLLAYSPYHHVTKGRRYPATLFTVFDGDTRVDPLHARKMCAAMQAATTASFEDAPVLLRREVDVGHAARSISRRIDLDADVLTFLSDRLGLPV
jgi:prolyl oligopeptidase